MGRIISAGILSRDKRRELYKTIPKVDDAVLSGVIEYGRPKEFQLNDLRNIYLWTKPEERPKLIEGYRQLIQDVQNGELEVG